MRQGVSEAATYNPDTQAVTIYQPVVLTLATRLLILTEASSGDTLLYSRLHAVSALPWSHAIPDLQWQGVYRAGPRAGEEDNMVVNENRYLRGDVEVLAVAADGTVTLRFAGETIALAPGEGHPIVRMVDEARQQYSRLVLYHQGEWSMQRVTLAFPAEGGETP